MHTATGVDAVITTELLNTRPERTRDFRRENEILQDLALGLADSDQSLLDRLVRAAVRICDAGSAGLSLHGPAEGGEAKLHWVAVDGEYAKYLGGALPLFSPCGVVLDRDRAELFNRPERVFTYFSEVRPEIVEALVIPMRAGGRSLGTIWIASHSEGPGFTAGDLSVMTTLANFTAAALTLLGRERAAHEGAERERAERARAEDSNRRKDEFLSTISHELRTPLHAILSWSELLMEGLPEADARDAAVSINRNAERQMHLVEDLLDSARLLSRGPSLDPRPVEVGDLVSAVIDGARPAVTAKALTIQSSCAPGAMTVMADAARLHQAVDNIFGNAVKFTPDGGAVRLVVDREGGSVSVRITDTGMGIPPDFLPRIFERFSQADSSYARRQGGLGLGLAIAREIVAAHGGSLQAHSQGLGLGATFTVTLPLSQPVRRERPPAPAPVVSLAGLRIVVVDDEPDARDALATVLRHRDATVETARSAREALEIVAARPPDVLLADIGMPHVDGYQLLEEVRRHADPRVNRLPAIAVTAYSSQPDRERIDQAGFNALVVKPVPARDLVRAVASVLGR